MSLRVLNPGSQTTVQDGGRPGLRRYGIPSSGAMDQLSLQLGNLLVGNALHAAGLETLLQGLRLEAIAPLCIALTGGDLSAELNGQPVPCWTTLTMNRGDELAFKRRVTGCRATLAVRGGIAVPEFLGSRSMFTKGRMGQPVRAGDLLPVGECSPRKTFLRKMLPPHLRPSLGTSYQVRVIPGPQTEYFTRSGIETFFGAEYRISPKSDRQGFRTSGPPVETLRGSDIITDPTPLGAVQIPGDGQPIILLRDGQVTGGYAKIATVIATDLDLFGRMASGDTVRFVSVTRDEALAAAEEQRSLLNYLAVALAD